MSEPRGSDLHLAEEVGRLRSKVRHLEIAVRRQAKEQGPGQGPGQEWFQVLFERCPVPYQSLDAAGCILEANDAWLEALGYERQDVKGRWFGDFLAEGQQALFRERFPRFKELGHTEGVVFEMLRKDGGVFTAEFTGKVAYDEKGDFLRTHCVFRDITEHRRIEQVLREHQERFRKFFELAPEYCYIISPDGLILDANQGALRAMGYTRDELIGRPVISTLYSPECQEKAKALFARWKQHGSLSGEEMTVVTKAGQERVVLLSAAAVRDADGQILHSTSIQTDITDRRGMEEALRRQVHDLERFNKLTVDRELRMIELKREINDLLAKAGEPERYKIV